MGHCPRGIASCPCFGFLAYGMSWSVDLGADRPSLCTRLGLWSRTHGLRWQRVWFRYRLRPATVVRMLILPYQTRPVRLLDPEAVLHVRCRGQQLRRCPSIG